MDKTSFRHYRHGQKLSADEYNRLVDMVSSIVRSFHTMGFADSTGFHTRRMPVSLPIRIAYCKNDAGEGNTIVCYLDDPAGMEITVKCNLISGSNLYTCTPYLTAGVPINVAFIDGEWKCIWPFEDHGICATCEELV